MIFFRMIGNVEHITENKEMNERHSKWQKKMVLTTDKFLSPISEGPILKACMGD